MKYYTYMVTDDDMGVLKYSLFLRVRDLAVKLMGWQLNLSIGLNQSLIN